MKTLKIMRTSPTAQLPTRATAGSAGYDLYADLVQPVVLNPGEIQAISTGIAIALEDPTLVALVFARSGLGIRHGVSLANGVGVVDSDYRGTISAGLTNHSDTPYTIRPGDRVAQLAIVPILTPPLEECESLPDSARGDGRFGSTGR